MNTKLAITFAASALAFGAQAATFDSTYQYRDANDLNQHAVIQGTPYVGGFDITDNNTDSFTVNPAIFADPQQSPGEKFDSQANYVAPGPVIKNGIMEFWFSDTEGDTFNINVDGSAFNALLTGNGPVTFQNYGLNAQIKLDLQASGKIDYTVTVSGAAGRVILFDYAALGVNIEQPTTTPDGGATAMLLGLGTLGAAALRRKLS